MFELERLAHGDVEEYIQDCKRTRRKSLAVRAKEKRRHKKWKEQQKEMQLQEQRHTSHLKSLDAQHTALFQQQERARRAMDALRSVGFQFKGNPFGNLMNM
jgi:23S rRNA G2069 N7-methylase RlmK/C1962 C5-methylase RlmI